MFASISAVATHGVHAAVLVVAAAPIGYLLLTGRGHDRAVAVLRASRDDGAGQGLDGIVAAAERRATEGAGMRRASPRPTALTLLVIATLMAGIVHGAVCPRHFAEGTRFGVFFLVTAVAQFAIAGLAVTRRWRSVLVPAIVVSLGAVLLWIVTRTTGLPFHLAGREAVGRWDVLATVAELVTAVTAAALLVTARRTAAHGGHRPFTAAGC